MTCSTAGVGDDDAQAAVSLIRKAIAGAKIRESVDHVGIDEFIEESALAAAAIGFTTGLAGGPALILTIPADAANVMLQKIRVTAAVLYHRTGQYNFTFRELLLFAASDVGAAVVIEGARYVVRVTVQHGAQRLAEHELVKLVMRQLSKELLKKAWTRVIPVLGGAANGIACYGHVKSYGRAILATTAASTE